MSRFSKLTDDAFELELKEVMAEFERRALKDNENEEIHFDHISVGKEEALEIAHDPYKIRGIATGYYSLDKYLCGISKGEMTAIAADTSVGKTLFTINLINRAYKAKNDLFTTLYFSLDTATRNVQSRFFMMEEDADAYPLYFYRNTKGISFERVRKTMMKCKEEVGLDLVVIDMLGSICRSSTNQTGETSSAVLKFRELALELDVHIILMNHVSMQAAKRKDARPHYSDIKDSSSVYQDSDVVIMLGRDNLNPAERNTMWVSVQKNRNKGRTGEMFMDIDWNTLQMKELYGH